MSGSGQRWQVLRTCVGFIYPVVKSVQAILSEDMEDDLTWLRYWVVLALVSLVEMAVDPMVDYFPAYLLAKCAFLIWCMAPSPNNGASFVFTQVSQNSTLDNICPILFMKVVFPLFKKRYMQMSPVVEDKITWVNFFRRNKR